jgi:hypothetical protein
MTFETWIYRDDKESVMPREILHFFDYEHLANERLKTVSKQFYDLAVYVDSELPESAESSTALRKLLEAKDAAVRAAL